jgi:hypothetical protein
MTDNRGPLFEEEPLVPETGADAPTPSDADLIALRQSWTSSRSAGRSSLRTLVRYCSGVGGAEAGQTLQQVSQDPGGLDLLLRTDEALAALRAMPWQRVQEIACARPKETDDHLRAVAGEWLSLLSTTTTSPERRDRARRSSAVSRWQFAVLGRRLALTRGEELSEGPGRDEILETDLRGAMTFRLVEARMEADGTLIAAAIIDRAGDDLEGRAAHLELRTKDRGYPIATSPLRNGRVSWTATVDSEAGRALAGELPPGALSVRFGDPPSPEDLPSELVAIVRERRSGSAIDVVPLQIEVTAHGGDLALMPTLPVEARAIYREAVLRLELSTPGGWQHLGEWPVSAASILLPGTGEAGSGIVRLLKAELFPA